MAQAGGLLVLLLLVVAALGEQGERPRTRDDWRMNDNREERRKEDRGDAAKNMAKEDNMDLALNKVVRREILLKEARKG